ncbi:porin family protein [Flavobacterium sp.]|uniref:porin family protein n=1 Tax=Flavobacterium sp. TaxID=239 RepID=UPI00286E2603|nr:porin family protein [Flavobacterium sp.]
MKNLKTIMAIALLISHSQFTFSQNSSDSSKLKFGFKGGVNFSNLYTDNVEDTNVLTGFNAGLFAKLPITSSLAIQPELLYTTKGAKLTYNNYFVNGAAKFNLNYIELPVLLVINLTNNFNIHAGPYIAYLVDGNAINDSQGTLFDIENNLKNEDYNKFDMGLSVGVGFDADQLGFGVRYNYGLQKVGKERSFLGTNYTFPDGKNSVINLYVSYSIL